MSPNPPKQNWYNEISHSMRNNPTLQNSYFKYQLQKKQSFFYYFCILRDAWRARKNWIYHSKRQAFAIGSSISLAVVLLYVLFAAIGNTHTGTQQKTAHAGQISHTKHITIQSMNPVRQTPTPQPPTPTPEPPAPTTAPVVQQEQPTQPPTTLLGVNGNPWGYNFIPGKHIYEPNRDFCKAGYFTCVGDFWENAYGYVVLCDNGKYSHAGGTKTACTRDDGVRATLYRH